MAHDYYKDDEDFGDLFGAITDISLTAAEEKWIDVYIDTRDKSFADAESGKPFKNVPPSAKFQRELRSRLDYRNAKPPERARRIVKEIADLAFFDVRDIFDEDGHIIPVHRLPKNVTAAIASIDVITNDAQTSVLKYKFHNKNTALESLARQENLYKDDNKLNADIVTTEDGSKNSVRRLAFLLNKGVKALPDSEE